MGGKVSLKICNGFTPDRRRTISTRLRSGSQACDKRHALGFLKAWPLLPSLFSLNKGLDLSGCSALQHGRRRGRSVRDGKATALGRCRGRYPQFALASPGVDDAVARAREVRTEHSAGRFVQAVLLRRGKVEFKPTLTECFSHGARRATQVRRDWNKQRRDRDKQRRGATCPVFLSFTLQGIVPWGKEIEMRVNRLRGAGRSFLLTILRTCLHSESRAIPGWAAVFAKKQSGLSNFTLDSVVACGIRPS